MYPSLHFLNAYVILGDGRCMKRKAGDLPGLHHCGAHTHIHTHMHTLWQYFSNPQTIPTPYRA